MQDEKIYIVDKNDAVLKIKTRAELNDIDCWRIVSIWITSPRGDILLQKRNPDKRILPGVWTAAVEGTVTYGDSYEKTAYKELREEIGLENIELEPGRKYYGKWGNLGSRQAQSYRAIYTGRLEDLTLQADEVAAVKWFTVHEIEELHAKQPELIPLFEIYKYFGFL